MTKRDKVTPIRKTDSPAETPQDREERIQQGGRSMPSSSDGRSKTGEQGVSNRDVQEETARQAKVMPFREEARKRNKSKIS